MWKIWFGRLSWNFDEIRKIDCNHLMALYRSNIPAILHVQGQFPKLKYCSERQTL